MQRGGLDARLMVEALGGHWTGRGGLCFCPAHPNRRTPALSVSIGKRGNAVFHCHAGCSYTDIMTALRDGAIVQGGGVEPGRSDPEASARAISEAEHRRIKNAQRAISKWHAARPFEGSLVETYLAKRGLRGPIPQSLRYLPDEWHPSGRFAAMVACLQGVSSPALHLTFLNANGTKAPVQPSRLFVGSAHGGGVCLASRPGPFVGGEGIESPHASRPSSAARSLVLLLMGWCSVFNWRCGRTYPRTGSGAIALLILTRSGITRRRSSAWRVCTWVRRRRQPSFASPLKRKASSSNG